MNRPPKDIGPWKRLSSDNIYSNPWVKFYHDEVLDPSGRESIYGVVEFENSAIGVVALDEHGDIYLVGQHRYPLDIYFWEIPEGGCPSGEKQIDAAKRELKEETGLEAKNWVDLGPVALSNSVSNETGRLYLARDLILGPAAPDPTEKLAVKKISFEKAYNMAMTGEIWDSLSVIGLARAKYYLDNESL